MGGAPESERQFLGASTTFQYMLDDLGAVCEGIVTMGGSDKKGLAERPDVRKKLCRMFCHQIALQGKCPEDINNNGSFWEHPLRSSTCWMIWEQSVKVS